MKLNKKQHITKDGIVKRNPVFKNLIKFNDKDKEITRSILNNGFFTVAHNWSSDDRDDFIKLFKKFDSSQNLLFKINTTFDYLDEYEYGKDEVYDESSGEYYSEKDGAWKNMVDMSSRVDKLILEEKIDKKMMKYINW